MDSTFVLLRRYVDPDYLADAIVAFGLKLLAAILTLIVGLFLIRILTSLVSKASRPVISDPTVHRYTVSATRIALWVVLAVVLLGVFGVETTSFVVIVGAAGIAIGLALQGSLSNFAAGFMLMLFRPFKVGDQVETGGVTGTVMEIGIFTTTVDTPDHVRAFVPNSTVFSGVIKNKSILEYLRVDMKITVASGADPQRVQQMIARVLSRNELVLDVPAPEVKIVEDDSPGVTFAVRPYCKLANEEAVRNTVQQEMWRELREADVDVLKQ